MAFEAAVAQQAPRIDGFDVQQVRRLNVGTELDFTVYGTAGARAVLRIEGADRRLILDETRVGVYQGVYVLTNRDTIEADSKINVSLRLGNQVATAQLQEPLVRGYQSRRAAPPAQNSPRIERFEVQANSELRSGYELPFSMFGTPGGQASIVIAGGAGRFFLDEMRPGEYAGIYTIRDGDSIASNSVVTGDLRVGDNYARATLGQPLVRAAAQARRSSRCNDCGVVEAINVVEVKGDGNYFGTIAGGVVGALIGSQIGGGRGRTAAQVAGAVGGAYAGNRIQNNSNKRIHYELVVRLQAGGTQTVTYETDPGYRVGESVRIVNNVLVRN